MNELVKHIYRATLSPTGFTRLLPDVEAEIARLARAPADAPDVLSQLPPAGMTGGVHEALAELAPHVATAADIQARLGHLPHEQGGRDELLALAPVPAVILSEALTVLHANERARAAWPRPAFADLFRTRQAQQQVRDLLREGFPPGGPALKLIDVGAPGAPTRWAVIRPLQGYGAQVAGGRVCLATFMSSSLSSEARNTLATAYGRTTAEIDIAAALAQGDDPAAVARARRTSIETVRGQIKSIKHKMGVRDIPDLVRTVSEFSAGVIDLDAARAPARTNGAVSGGEVRFMTLRCGRRLDYMSQGDPGGAPVILFHNIPYGTELPRAAQAAARERGLHVIAPYRAGHGLSDPVAAAGPDALLDQAVADTRELMDHLGIERARLVGNAAGSTFALRFAELHRSRCTGLVMVSRAPVWRGEWLGELAPHHRAFAIMLRYTPGIANLVAWAILAYVNKHDSREYARNSAYHSPPDVRAIDDPETASLMAIGIRHGYLNGVAPYCREFEVLEIDLTHAARGLDLAMHVLHGAQDCVVRPEFSRRFVEAVPQARLTIAHDAGHYLFYSHWELVLKAVDGLPA